jgi:hypothetical protein
MISVKGTAFWDMPPCYLVYVQWGMWRLEQRDSPLSILFRRFSVKIWSGTSNIRNSDFSVFFFQGNALLAPPVRRRPRHVQISQFVYRLAITQYIVYLLTRTRNLSESLHTYFRL